MNVREQIRERIIQARHKLDVSQRELSERAGLTEPSCISRYERGATVPRADTIAKLAPALGVSADWLLSISDDPTNMSIIRFPALFSRVSKEARRLAELGVEVEDPEVESFEHEVPIRASDIVAIIPIMGPGEDAEIGSAAEVILSTGDTLQINIPHAKATDMWEKSIKTNGSPTNGTVRS